MSPYVLRVDGVRVSSFGFCSSKSSYKWSGLELVRMLVDGVGGAPMMFAEEMERRHCCVLDAAVAPAEICDQHACRSDNGSRKRLPIGIVRCKRWRIMTLTVACRGIPLWETRGRGPSFSSSRAPTQTLLLIRVITSF